MYISELGTAWERVAYLCWSPAQTRRRMGCTSSCTIHPTIKSLMDDYIAVGLNSKAGRGVHPIIYSLVYSLSPVYPNRHFVSSGSLSKGDSHINWPVELSITTHNFGYQGAREVLIFLCIVELSESLPQYKYIRCLIGQTNTCCGIFTCLAPIFYYGWCFTSWE